MSNQATIIGLADSTRYLVGETDSNGHFWPLSSCEEIKRFPSLVEAKQFLKDMHIETAQLKLETAYDEMCGLPSVRDSSVRIDL